MSDWFRCHGEWTPEFGVVNTKTEDVLAASPGSAAHHFVTDLLEHESIEPGQIVTVRILDEKYVMKPHWVARTDTISHETDLEPVDGVPEPPSRMKWWWVGWTVPTKESHEVVQHLRLNRVQAWCVGESSNDRSVWIGAVWAASTTWVWHTLKDRFGDEVWERVPPREIVEPQERLLRYYPDLDLAPEKWP